MDVLPQDAALRLPHLKQLGIIFIQGKQNIILIGSPGTGKTHIATELGLEACLAGYQVYFTSVSSLVNQF